MPTLLIVIIASSILFSFALPYFIKKKVANKTHSLKSEKENGNASSSDTINKSDNKVKSKRRPFVSIIIVLSIFILPIFIAFNGCESSYSSVTFAIEENDKNYIYSPNEYLVNQAVKQDEVPSGLNSNIIYFIDDHVYMRPDNLERIINILSGNFKIIEKNESSYNGYAVNDSSNVYNFKVQNKAGSKIGEIQAINVVTLSDKSQRSKSMEIKWKTLPELEAIENCSVESIWVVTNPYPGKTVGNWEDDILVNIDDINTFYGNSFELVFDEEASVLYFKKSSNI